MKIIGISFINLLLLVGYVAAQPGVFDVIMFGAKPDCEISAALLAAWKEACACINPSTVVIPKGSFLLNQVELAGPCKAPVTLRLEACVKAPADPAQLKPDMEWVTIRDIDNLAVLGGGTFDGQGEMSWKQNDCKATGKCSNLPNNLAFNFLNNSIIQDVTTLNSKLFQVNVLGCKNITFLRFTVTAPAESLNTDGIHIGRSEGVKILESDIKTGDDCISIGDGTRQVNIEKVTCGPGHGISVGSLGRYPKEEPVVGIFVKNCTITGTDNGVRIKTWPASEPGEASDIHFEDIVMNNVSNPIILDQQYCPSGQCNLDVASKVKHSKISFKNIRGTSGTQMAVKLVCSSDLPCDGVEVADINLTYNGKEGPATSTCCNVKPILAGVMIPAACANDAPGQPGAPAQPGTPNATAAPAAANATAASAAANTTAVPAEAAATAVPAAAAATAVPAAANATAVSAAAAATSTAAAAAATSAPAADAAMAQPGASANPTQPLKAA